MEGRERGVGVGGDKRKLRKPLIHISNSLLKQPVSTEMIYTFCRQCQLVKFCVFSTGYLNISTAPALDGLSPPLSLSSLSLSLSIPETITLDLSQAQLEAAEFVQWPVVCLLCAAIHGLMGRLY